MSLLRLSILDQSPVSADRTPAQAIRDSLRLAATLDGHGFTRYWFAEHHDSPGFAGVAPEVLVALALERTRQLRIGSGGVLLPRYSAAKVSEVFGVLAAAHGGRLDLGLGRAGVGSGDYPGQVAELRDRLAADGDLLPELWLLGAGTSSSRVAAALGTGFAYGHFLNPAYVTEALRGYQQDFTASAHQSRPAAVLAVRAVVADTEARAAELAATFLLWRSRKDLGLDLPFPTTEQSRKHSWTLAESHRREVNAEALFYGSGAQVHAELGELADRLGVAEVMVNTPLADLSARIESYFALAGAAGWSPLSDQMVHAGINGASPGVGELGAPIEAKPIRRIDTA